jgi:UDP-N-acetylmuramyl pentapeptide phosphotransferase/UDP-N-acetylglucosamine-1-phosphate transferase
MILFYSYLALGAFILSLLATRITIETLRKKNALLDMPGPRSNHKRPTPRGGGLAVVFTLLIFLLSADASYWLVLGMLLLAAISFVDDWIRLSPITRLCVQIIAVLAALHDVQIPALYEIMPIWLAQGLTVIAWVWFINLFNFMDGIDGIAGAEMISISGGLIAVTLVLGTFSNPLSLLALVVLGAGFGFLWWNWHPAKIFLGDVGSIPIGYLLGYMLLMAAQNGYYYAALILPAYYLADATITLLMRIWKRERIWEAHSQHFYQKAVRGGRRHDAVAVVVLGVNMLLIMLAVLAELDRESGWIHLSVAYGMVGAVLFFFMAHPVKPRREAKS